MDKRTVMELGKLSKEVDGIIKGMTDKERANFAQMLVALTIPNFEVEKPGGIEAVRRFMYRQLGKEMKE